MPNKQKYRKKPVIVEAEGPITEERTIKTLEGDMTASVGDFIITGVQGEEYPCKPNIFHETYEAVDPLSDEAMIASLESTINGQANTIERFFAIERIFKNRNWWQRLRNKQITCEDVDRNIEETEKRRNKLIHGEET